MNKEFSVRTLVDRALNFTYFDDDVIKNTYYPGSGKLLVIAGDNSSGKSFLGKFFEQLVHSGEWGKIEVMRISMQLRTSQGFERTFIFGDESENATGVLSLGTVKAGISTCKKRENDHILFLDEPDIGLAESYQGALGKLIAQFASDLPDKTKALCIVTHSRRIVRHLAPLNPHFLRLGDKLTLEEFLIEPPDREIEDLETLTQSCRDLRRKIQHCINTGTKVRAEEAKKKTALSKSSGKKIGGHVDGEYGD